MRKRQKAEVQENISPNLIPMIDIMFLLLLFFMLGADMSQRQMAELVLPTATKVPEPIKDTGQNEGKTLIINVHHTMERGVTCPIYAAGGVCREQGHWLWAILSREYDKNTLKEQLALEAQREMEDHVDAEAKKVLSGRKVLIRADTGAPYGDVQNIIELCGTVGIYKIEVAAARPTPANLK